MKKNLYLGNLASERLHLHASAPSASYHDGYYNLAVTLKLFVFAVQKLKNDT